jgi:hypothetical protein
MNDRIFVLDRLYNSTNDLLCPLWSCGDSHQLERTLEAVVQTPFALLEPPCVKNVNPEK